MIALAFASLSLIIWIGLILFRGNFWRSDQKLDIHTDRDHWPSVTAIIPARNEVETIGATVTSLLEQDKSVDLNVIVVDDNSDDGTAEAAGTSDHLTVIMGKPIVPGWSGKLWAVSQGISYAGEAFPDTDYLLLTDADIEHHATNLMELVSKAEEGRLGLVSLMVKLRCVSFWEKLLIPAFIFFFQKLCPFPMVNNPKNETAAAAGGCMLVSRQTLVEVGGVEEIKERLIDDCALAALIKPHKPIWLGLSEKTVSLRAYQELSEIWNMVARTAFVQLNHSVVALIGTVIGMVLIYLAPAAALVLGLLTGQDQLAMVGGLCWLIMTMSYVPTLKLYDLPLLYVCMLPVSGFLYTLMTISSAFRHWKGQGGAWKGRSYPSG